jgi:eukaryotic-like serine/threonine-protein kinase
LLSTALKSKLVASGTRFIVAATDGSGKLERLAASNSLIPNDWSAAGRFLVFVDFQHGAPELDFLDFRNHSQTAYAPGAEAQFSPGGKWVAFTGPGSVSSGTASYAILSGRVGSSLTPAGT